MTREAAYHTITRCRSCGSEELTPLFSLGTQAVSDFVPADKVHAGVQCPLDVVLCEGCTLVQLKHTAPQDFLYTRHYWYRSGVTQTMRDALADVARAACDRVMLEPGDVVLDIGSNDGTLLRCFPETCMRVGVEPAENLATKENYAGLALVNGFWCVRHDGKLVAADSELVELPTKPKVVCAIGMFYDLDDPNAFIADVARVLHPDGVFIAQLMCLKQTLERRDVGNFAHEHLEFYSLKSLEDLFNRHGLSIQEVEENGVNGGSYRLFVRHAKQWQLWTPSKEAAFERERKMCLDALRTYTNFFLMLEENISALHRFVISEKACGKSIHVLGASTKGNVILQYAGLDNHLIEAASDRSPEKWGRYTVGTGIPIVSEEQSREMRPDYYLCLPYAFRAEMMERERTFRERGGKFLFAIPTFEVV